jgi:dTDP-4-dehydrorhamnose reductase
MKKILITGANGMLGSEAVQIFSDCGYQVIKGTRENLDITNRDLVNEFFAKNDFDLVLHAAAYTKVDDAESNKELAFLINSEGAKNVAIASRKKLIPIIYISTDYVFDGEKGSPYLPQDKTNPINIYGASKLAGEEEIKKENPKHYIVRTSWLYGKQGKNFVDTMIALSKTQKSLKVVNDQFGCPTWTLDLLDGIRKLVERESPFGIYHICGKGVTSWFEFSRKIFEILKINIEVIPVLTSEFPRPAKRPKFSAMDIEDEGNSWDRSLKCYLKL